MVKLVHQIEMTLYQGGIKTKKYLNHCFSISTSIILSSCSEIWEDYESIPFLKCVPLIQWYCEQSPVVRNTGTNEAVS